MVESDRNPSPPWEALHLVAHYLDPKTLAVASCVSKSWLHNLSSDHLWLPLCDADFPSFSSLFSLYRKDTKVSLRRMYGACAAAASRRLRRASKPRIALHSLAFAIDVRLDHRSVSTVTVNPDRDLRSGQAFRFRFRFPEGGLAFPGGDLDAGIRVSWHVVTEGWEAVFCVMDREGSGRFVGSPTPAPATAMEGWFSRELPAPGCCSSASAASGLMAELKVRLCPAGGEGRWRVEEVCGGVLNVLRWRYVSVEDALRYLQHFLLPC